MASRDKGFVLFRKWVNGNDEMLHGWGVEKLLCKDVDEFTQQYRIGYAVDLKFDASVYRACEYHADAVTSLWRWAEAMLRKYRGCFFCSSEALMLKGSVLAASA